MLELLAGSHYCIKVDVALVPLIEKLLEGLRCFGETTRPDDGSVGTGTVVVAQSD